MSHKDKKNKDESSSSSSASEVKPKHKDKKKVKDKKKPEKEKKSSKRGPRGAQWMTWKIPYQESSILGGSFMLAAKKGGVKEKELVKYIKKQGGNPVFIIRCLKKGHSKGWKWETDDSHDRLRITNYKVGDKKWHR